MQRYTLTFNCDTDTTKQFYANCKEIDALSTCNYYENVLTNQGYTVNSFSFKADGEKQQTVTGSRPISITTAPPTPNKLKARTVFI